MGNLISYLSVKVGFSGSWYEIILIVHLYLFVYLQLDWHIHIISVLLCSRWRSCALKRRSGWQSTTSNCLSSGIASESSTRLTESTSCMMSSSPTSMWRHFHRKYMLSHRAHVSTQDKHTWVGYKCIWARICTYSIYTIYTLHFLGPKIFQILHDA